MTYVRSRRSRRWHWYLTACLVTGGLTALPLSAQQPTALATPAPVELDPTPTTPLSNLVELARRGQFNDILSRIQSDPAFGSNGSLQMLARDLAVYKEHQEKHATARQKNFQTAREQMLKEMEAGQYDIALVRAIDAHANAPHGRQWLADEQVVKLVKLSKEAALKAEAQGDWLVSLTLWRNLDLLYLEDSTFRPQVRNAEQHARLLRLYAPEELQRLHIQREAQKGNPAPEPLNLASDQWQDRLTGVRPAMFHDAMREAKNRHIDNPTYAQLMLGSLERLETLLEAVGLSSTFPNMQDSAKVTAFKDHLKAIQQRVNEAGEGFSYRQLLNTADSIFETNRQTINLPEEILVFEMTDGALGSLDPFTAVIWPHDLAQFSRSTEGRFSGVGIQISKPGRITVTQVTPDSPAAKAGIEKGDLLTQINGKDTSTMGVNELMRQLEQSREQAITLQASRPGHVGTLTFKLEAVEGELGLRIARPGRLTVVSPLSGTPAHRAGLKPNDLILSVNGQDTNGWSLDQAVREITGPEGTQVAITIQRAGHQEPMTFNLTRTSIEIDSIRGWKLLSNGKWDYYIDPERQIGYIRLSQFIPQSSDELEAAFEEMNKQGRVQGVILDLRYNPGGLLRKAADVVDRFVRSGRIVSTVDAKGNTTSQYSARPHNTLRSVPMVVLINQGSASASEIVSGALQDYQSALIVGSRSYGKGSVQDLTPIDGGKAMLKLTTQYYKLPGGRIIHRKPDATNWGIEPDLSIPMTEQQAYEAIEFRRDLDILYDAESMGNADKPLPKPEDMFTKALDPQLEAALMYLRVRLTTDTYMASNPRPTETAGPIVPPTTP